VERLSYTPGPKPKVYSQLTVRVDPAVISRLNREAQRAGQSRSQTVAEILTRWAVDHPEKGGEEQR